MCASGEEDGRLVFVYVRVSRRGESGVLVYMRVTGRDGYGSEGMVGFHFHTHDDTVNISDTSCLSESTKRALR